ncbi:MAG: 3-hydroxyacyl-ACP dehydratase FabZ [bacterium]|nr:3-hydroxyacyl-ACP dehydratase FabZ [bacterium]
MPFDARQILEVLPHRYPFLLIDRIVEHEPYKRALGYKNVTVNEPYFQGHFPGNPVMPGVLMIEALAQLGGTVMLTPGEYRRKLVYLAGVDKAKFRRPVIPGDQLLMKVEVLWMRKHIGKVGATAKVEGQLAVSAELMFSIFEDQRIDLMDASVLHI